MKIKICGLRDEQNINDIDTEAIDFLGFIFYEQSPRYVGTSFQMPKTSKLKVGVFVNETAENILKFRKQYDLDCIQLHGNETVELCKELKENGCKIIKAFGVSDSFSFQKCTDYELYTDLFLFDTATANYGGSGQLFPWELLANYQGNLPFLLSGGLGLEQMNELKKFTHPKLYGYDFNSALEIAPAYKDIQKVQKLIQLLRNEEISTQ